MVSAEEPVPAPRVDGIEPCVLSNLYIEAVHQGMNHKYRLNGMHYQMYQTNYKQCLPLSHFGTSSTYCMFQPQWNYNTHMNTTKETHSSQIIDGI